MSKETIIMLKVTKYSYKYLFLFYKIYIIFYLAENETIPKLILMVGLPSSGKTTFAE